MEKEKFDPEELSDGPIVNVFTEEIMLAGEKYCLFTNAFCDEATGETANFLFRMEDMRNLPAGEIDAFAKCTVVGSKIRIDN